MSSFQHDPGDTAGYADRDDYECLREQEFAEHLEAKAEREVEAARCRTDFKPPPRVKRKDAPKPDESWKWTVLDRDQGCCVCSDPASCEPPFQSHHIVPAQRLRRQRPDLLWDVRLGMGVCSKAHRQHHNRVRPIFWDEVPLDCRRFLTGQEFEPWLERHYPIRKREAAA